MNRHTKFFTHHRYQVTKIPVPEILQGRIKSRKVVAVRRQKSRKLRISTILQERILIVALFHVTGIHEDLLPIEARCSGAVDRDHGSIHAFTATGHIREVFLCAHIQRIDLITDIVIEIREDNSRPLILDSTVIHSLPHGKAKLLILPVKLYLDAKTIGSCNRFQILHQNIIPALISHGISGRHGLTQCHLWNCALTVRRADRVRRHQRRHDFRRRPFIALICLTHRRLRDPVLQQL